MFFPPNNFFPPDMKGITVSLFDPDTEEVPPLINFSRWQLRKVVNPFWHLNLSVKSLADSWPKGHEVSELILREIDSDWWIKGWFSDDLCQDLGVFLTLEPGRCNPQSEGWIIQNIIPQNLHIWNEDYPNFSLLRVCEVGPKGRQMTVAFGPLRLCNWKSCSLLPRGWGE